MTTPDWADEEAGTIAGEVCSCFEYEHGTIECPHCHCYFELASALRAAFLRGRVAGLREAADSIYEWSDHNGSKFIAPLRIAADKLEEDKP